MGPVESLKTFAFPHFFPQLWKTSGGDPTAGAAGVATVAHGSGADNFLSRLTPFEAFDYYLSFSVIFLSLQGSDNECDVPAKPPAPKAHAWISRAYGHQERSPGVETPSRKGT